MSIGYLRTIDQEHDVLYTIRCISEPLINFMRLPLSQTFEDGTSDISDAIRPHPFLPKGPCHLKILRLVIH